jgi:hypothetical protein
MPDWMDEAKNLADDHSDIVDKGLDQATQEVENKTGGKFDSQIQGAEQQAEGYMGMNQQGQQDQGQQDQGQYDQGQQDQGQ